MNKKTDFQLNESYKHIKPYLNVIPELKEMCGQCERYCGKEHNYEECRNMMCFKFFLAFAYLEWANS